MIPPAITIISGPPDMASSTTANFQLASSEDETSYQCQLDANAWEACSASTTAADLIEGSHSLEIKGIDRAGNTGSSTIKTWLVDLTAATSTMADLDASYEATGFTVAWSGEDMNGSGATTTASGLENYDVQYKIDSGDWQDWLSATTSTSTIFNLAIANGQTASFHVRARDSAGHIGEWSSGVSTQINNNAADHLVINEVQIGGVVANDEFIELYNPTDADINLSGYSIQYHGPDAHNFEKKNFLSDSIIKAKKYFLIASVEYGGSVTADFLYAGFTLAAGGGTIFLAQTNDILTDTAATSTIVIDRLAYGSGDHLFPEGSAYPAAPAAKQSLVRKAAAASTAETMAVGGIHASLDKAYDSDDNSYDFVLRTVSDPKGTQTYDVARSSDFFPSNFGRDYMFTDFKPTSFLISGIAIKNTTSRASGSFTLTLCKGAITHDNFTEKVNCGTDILITQKTCAVSNGGQSNAWQNCDFVSDFALVSNDDYYVVVSGNSWVGYTWSDINYGVGVACGFNNGVDGPIDRYCFSGGNKGYMSLRTYTR